MRVGRGVRWTVVCIAAVVLVGVPLTLVFLPGVLITPERVEEALRESLPPGSDAEVGDTVVSGRTIELRDVRLRPGPSVRIEAERVEVVGWLGASLGERRVEELRIVGGSIELRPTAPSQEGVDGFSVGRLVLSGVELRVMDGPQLRGRRTDVHAELEDVSSETWRPVLMGLMRGS